MQTSPELAERLGKLTLLLSSTHEGEIAAAARAIGKVLETAGADWHTYAEAVAMGFRAPQAAPPAPSSTPRRSRPPKPSPPPTRAPRTRWQAAAMEVLRVALDRLTKAENQFLTGQLDWVGDPTPAQQRWLRAICSRFGVGIENG